MMRGFAVVSTLCALLVAVPGAAADVTRDQFERMANAMCATTTKRADAITKKINDGKKVLDPETDPVTAGRAILAVLPPGLRLFERLGRLERPAADSARIGQWLRGSISAYRQLRPAAKALVESDVETWRRLSGPAFEAASAADERIAYLDLQACAET